MTQRMDTVGTTVADAGGVTGAPFSLGDWLDGSLFLDFDGTLVELADTPEAVIVAPGLVEVLGALQKKLGGRLAIVTGRPIEQIDAMLAPLKLAVAGVHGAERRSADGSLHYAAAPSMLAMASCAQALVARYPDLRLEEKRGALAVHYRQAPQLGTLVKQAMREALEQCPGMVLLDGKMVVEVKPAGSTKGTALGDFMQEVPFAGHRPVFIGDDTTDEAGIAYAQQYGGLGVKIGAGSSAAWQRLATPQALREALTQAATPLNEGY